MRNPAFLVGLLAFCATCNQAAATSLANVAANIPGAGAGAASYLVSVFTYAGAFVAPAAAVVAIKSIYELAKSA